MFAVPENVCHVVQFATTGETVETTRTKSTVLSGHDVVCFIVAS